MRARITTFVLLATLSGMLVLLGASLDGGTGQTFLTTVLVVATVGNLVVYFASDKLALRLARAQPLDEDRYPDVYETVENLAARAGQPVPRLYVSPSPRLNLFATGRSPGHAAISINQGLLDALGHDELEAVLAHELQHVADGDVLVGSVAATISTAITSLALVLRWIPVLGGSRERGPSPLALLGALVAASIAAGIIHASVSRSRESRADMAAAASTGNPRALASALRTIEASSTDPRRAVSMTPAESNAAMGHLFLVAPSTARGLAGLFVTHPPLADRIERLERQAAWAALVG